MRARGTTITRLRLALCAIALLATGVAADPGPRFFFAGDGRLSLRDAHGSGALDVRFRRADGSYDQAALSRIRRFLRSRGDRKESDIALRTIEILDFVESHFRPRRIKVVSGYRSPAYNDRLRAGGALAAQASLHTQGLAVDVMLEGVKLQPAWDELRELKVGGVGLYEKQHFLHLDSGPPRFWEPETSKVGENLSAGNARVFARTEFDLYTSASLVGGMVELHSVTALPLRIEPVARLIGQDVAVTLTPQAGLVRDPDGCLRVDEREPRVRAAIESIRGDRVAIGRYRLGVATCSPRIESTPETIESNEIEIGAALGGEGTE